MERRGAKLKEQPVLEKVIVVHTRNDSLLDQGRGHGNRQEQLYLKGI